MIPHSINFNTEVMENGEQRTRLILPDGSAYIMTEAGKSGAWQNSHYHVGLDEIYVVKKGWVGFAELVNGSLKLRLARENDQFSFKPMVSHNLYLPANSVIFTIKHGNLVQGDWHESKELDVLTKHLSEQQIKTIVGNR
jgi:hypothetical protein